MISITHVIPVEDFIPKSVWIEPILRKLDELHEDIGVAYSSCEEDGLIDTAIIIDYDMDADIPKQWRPYSAYTDYIKLLVEEMEASEELMTGRSKYEQIKKRVEYFTRGLKKDG